MEEIRAICNLTDDQFEARRKELREGLMPRVRGREELSDGLALLFDASPEMRDELEAFMTFERECCPGLGFSLEDASGALRLEIRGIAPNSNAFAGIPESTLPEVQQETPASPRRFPLLRALGLGSALSLFVCCVLPIGIAIVVGAQLAAPLRALDNPWAISLAGVTFASLLWLRERRRTAARTASIREEGCGC